MKTETKKGVEHPCLFCGKDIPHWRSNKKFCDEGCKSSHFNQQQKEARLEMGRVNSILKKNYEILKNEIKDDKHVKVSKLRLEKKGFNFKFLTHMVGDYRNCYLLAWRPIEKEQVIITRTPDSTFVEKD